MPSVACRRGRRGSPQTTPTPSGPSWSTTAGSSTAPTRAWCGAGPTIRRWRPARRWCGCSPPGNPPRLDRGGSGTAPRGATALAGVDSPPVSDLVDEMLLRSDNHIAEQLLKELGVVAEGRGETAAGARAVAAWTASVGAATPGSVVVDGSGLDPTNATSCQGLVAALDALGPDGVVGRGLPVAGRTGTLAGRFAATAAAGRLRAKTGTLDDVRALAGFVELPEGGTATFAFVANGQVGERTQAVEAFLAEVLATWRPPCPAGRAAPVDAPLAASAVLVPIAPGPWGAVAAPGLVTALVALEAPATAPLDRCARTSRTPVALGTG
ncbi:MAG: D-alanyl-D-alanine carboxypeptidase [Acidimicrobiales bacterium]